MRLSPGTLRDPFLIHTLCTRIEFCVTDSLLLQLRREFRAIADINGRATSLMSSWPDWVERLAVA